MEPNELKRAVDLRGYKVFTPEELKSDVITSDGTHRVFQGGAVAPKEKDEGKYSGYYARPAKLWRDGPNGREIRMEDGHGNKMWGN